jgi:hypothetical protein
MLRIHPVQGLATGDNGCTPVWQPGLVRELLSILDIHSPGLGFSQLAHFGRGLDPDHLLGFFLPVAGGEGRKRAYSSANPHLISGVAVN